MDVLTQVSIDNMIPDFESCFSLHYRYSFEDGYVSPFEIQLLELIEKYGNDSYIALIFVIQKIIDGDDIHLFECVYEALKILGHIEDKDTEYVRLSILAFLTYFNSRIILDGVGLGVASIDNPIMLPFFKYKRPDGCFWDLVEGQLIETLQENKVKQVEPETKTREMNVGGVMLTVDESSADNSANIWYKCQCGREMVNVGGYVLGENQSAVDSKIRTAAIAASEVVCQIEYYDKLDDDQSVPLF